MVASPYSKREMVFLLWGLEWRPPQRYDNEKFFHRFRFTGGNGVLP